MPTTNPVPSYDPTDLLFNAAKLDEVVNSASSTYADRLGTTRRTLAGLEAEFPNASANAAAAAASATQAANEAQAAQTSAGQASAQATAAQTARTGAEAARDAAMAGANVYDTTAAGLEATTNGQQFMVVSGNEIIRYRRDSATVATEVARYPTAGGSMIYRGAPASASMDFNTVTTPGLWLINGGQYNPPAGVTYPGLFVVRNFGTWVQQEYIPTGGSTQYGGKKWSRLINTSPSSIGAWVANYGYMGQLGALPDLNTIRTAGVYHVNSAPYNRPADSDATNTALLEVSVVGDYVVQKYMSYGSDFSGLIWTRTITDSTNTIGSWYRNDLYQGSLVSGDANTLTKTGRYFLNGQLTNCPLASGWLDVSRRGDWVLQELKPLLGGAQYTRTYRISNNTWYDWTGVRPLNGSITADLLAPQFDYKGTLSSGDVNSYTDSGGWMVIGAMSNAPSGSGWLTVKKFGTSGQFIVQQWIDFTYPEISYQRKFYGGTWSAWKTPISSDKGGKNIVCLGDSITQNGDYPTRLKALTGATTSNCGFAGTRLAVHVNDYDYLSMYRIAEYINTGDFQPLIDACDRLAGPPTSVDYRPIAARLAAVDWSTVDYIVAFHGTNDFAGDNPIGSDTDATGATLKGAINYTVDKICSAYPNIKILFVAPMWRSRILGAAGTQDPDTIPNGIGKYMIEYVDAIISRSNANKMPATDLYRTSGINKYNWQTMISDGLHPTSGVGYQRVAEKIAAALQANW